MIGSTIDAISRDKKILIDGRQQVGLTPQLIFPFSIPRACPFIPMP